jgi:hypothetical protein
MVPRDAQLWVEAKAKRRDEQLEQLDRLFANQTARIMYMQGRVAENPIEPVSCLTYEWESKSTSPSPGEMTEEDMTRFDRNMDAWSGVKPHV